MRMVTSYCAVMVVTAHGCQSTTTVCATSFVAWVVMLLKSSRIGRLGRNSHIESLPLLFRQRVAIRQRTENIQIRGNTVAKYSIQSRKPGIQFLES
jgi:hypothetical protein